MLDTRLACPLCNKRLKTTKYVAVGDRFRCPQCRESFHVQDKDFVMTISQPEIVLPTPARPETVPVLADPTPFPGTVVPITAALAPAPVLTPAPIPPAQPPSRVLYFVAAACAFVFCLVIGLIAGLPSKKKDFPESDQVAEKKKAENDEKPRPQQREEPREPEKKPEQGLRNEPSLQRPPEQKDPPRDDRRAEGEPVLKPNLPLARSSLPAEKQEEVNRAVDRGIAFLKANQQADGSWQSRGSHNVGMAALPALTLLECGVSPTDPVIQKALAHVRREGPSEMMTYDISLAILFLDRYGDPMDRRLIQRLALRLVAGQGPAGGWTYHCRDIFTPAEELQFFDILQQTRPKDPVQLFERDRNDGAMAYFVNSLPKQQGFFQQGTGRLDTPAVAMGLDQKPGLVVGKIESKMPNAASLPLEQLKRPQTKLQDVLPKLKQLPVLQPLPRAADLPVRETSDNSNTQFGIMGIWAAGRYNIPMERTMAMLVKRFRKTQNADGTWGYHYGAGQHGSPAMTCVGLLGLAVGHGLVAGSDPSKSRNIAEDPAIKNAMEALSAHLDPTRPPIGKMRGKGNARLPNGPNAQKANCYFLWSVERVGVLYNVNMIGDSDWYHWGVDVLLPRQQQSGAWTGTYGQSDTCMALLFLKRANLTRDLTARLNFTIKVKEENKDDK